MQRKFLVPLFFSLTPFILLTGVTDSFYLPKFIWIFLAVVLLFWIGIKEGLFSYRNTFILPAALLLIWYIITLGRCVNIFEGLHSIFILILFLTLYISLENVVARDNFLIDEFIRDMVIITVLVSVYGLLQVGGIDFVKWEVRNSPLSTLGRRNFAAEYLVMVIPYMYYLMIDKKKQWILYIPLVLSVIHLIFTFTRASYIAFLISGVVFFVLAGKRVNVKVAVIVLLSFLVFSQPLFSGIKTFERGTVKSRMLIWNITLKMIKKNPIMGVGPGNFIITYPYYAKDSPERMIVAHRVSSVHNDYLEVCAEAGIVGFVLFLYLLFSVFKASFVLYRGSGRKEKLLISGIISSMVAICVNGLASFPFKNPATLLLFWADVSFIGGIYRKRVGEKKIGVSYPLLKAYIIIFVITGIVFSYRGLKASRYMFLAKNTGGNLSLQFAEKSAMYNPLSFEYTFLTARIAIASGNYEKGYQYLLMAKNLHPYNDTLYNNMGLVYFKTGRIKEAEESYLYALTLNPFMADVCNNLGSLYIETGRYDEAIPYLEKAISLKPEFYLAYFNLGMAYYLKNDHKQAVNYFRKTLEINPQFTPAGMLLLKIEK